MPYSFFALLPLAACIVCAAFAFAAISRDPSDRINRASSLFMLAPSYWAFFEVVALRAPDAESAFVAVLLSTPGWVFIPPLIVHLIVQILDEERDGLLRRLSPWLFATSAGFTLLNWTTHLITPEIAHHPWGYTFVPGPAYPPYSVFTMFCAFIGLWKWTRDRAVTPMLEDERVSRKITIGFLAPILLASVTDAVFPIVGIPFPRMGTTCFGFLSVMIVVATVQRGYLFASPGVFAGQILEAMPEAVALSSPSGQILFVNAAFESTAGLDASRLTGAPVENFVPHPPLEVGNDLREVECEIVQATGERMPVSLSTCTITDRRGHPLGLALVFRDMREVASLRSRLVVSDRLAAVGQLAAGIAHEINNPIAFVHANLNLLRDHWGEVSKALDDCGGRDSMAEILAEGEEIIDESLDGVGRAAGIVRNVREFSHAGTRDREAADLNELLEGVIRVATFETTPDVSVERDFGEVPLISCSPQQLKQVFLNLIVNAIHAVGDRGVIRVTTQSGENEVAVLVDDDGCGIPPEIEERIFDPFFTTKDVGQGTGLGLSISHEIVRSEGGEISIEPKPGPGARIRVLLPTDA